MGVEGLASRPDLNGKSGRILGYDDASGRYMVSVRGDSEAPMSLQRKNCIVGAGVRVTLCELSSAHYNGQMARVLEVDTESARYLVQCQNGEEIEVKFGNVLC